MARVALERIDKTYPNSFRAVRELSLDVADGEHLAIVGPSGCGKTTLLRIVAGLERPTRGVVRIGQSDVRDLPPRRRDVAMVFQHGALYPHLTVYENLAFPLRMRGVPPKAIRHKVLETSQLVGVADLLERLPRQLSGGQAQRAALGRALVRRPACYLFDEPLSDLDARLRLELRTELKRFHQRLGITTIHVTHDQEEAMVLGQRVAVLRDGALQQVGPPEDVHRRPANRFVAGFLGSPPMNFFRGRLVPDPAGLRFDDGVRRLTVPERAAPVLAAHLGRQAILGVRPESFCTQPLPGMSGNSLKADATVVELLGDRALVYFRAEDGLEFVAKLDARDAPLAGAAAILHVDLDAVHYFADDEVGMSLVPAERRSQP